MTSEQLFERAKRSIPGGVNSPVRAFKSVGGTPRFIASASGCRLRDTEGREYIDYVGSWGPMILGHAHPEVVDAVCAAAGKGTSFGAPTELEVELAERICRLIPCVEKARLVNSGTEAAMSALRLARAYTGRSKFVKFDGCYHGHADSFLVQAGSGVATFGLPDSPGVPEDFTRNTISLPFNNLEAVERAFQESEGSIGCIILEPVTGNMGVVVPSAQYLSDLIELAHRKGAIVIFDEVMTGFRLAPGGAQERFRVVPDLTTLGKIVGGGLPIGAFGGKREIMDLLAPEGPVYQAGTLSGNPLAVTAGLKTLEILERDDPYQQLDEKTERLCRELASLAVESGVAVQVPRCGSMFTVYFTKDPVRDFEGAKACDGDRFARFFKQMLGSGVYLAPSPFEACFVSVAHDEDALGGSLEAARASLESLNRN